MNTLFDGSNELSPNGSDGSESEATVIPTSREEPRYLYYYVFTESIRTPSRRPAFRNNSYLGRVLANTVAPPQTAQLIKRRLCNIESVENFSSSKLFLSRSSKGPMDDEECASILTSDGIGSIPEKAMELVQVPRLSSLPTAPNKNVVINYVPRYIYYSLYTEDGAIRSKPDTAINASGSVARIDSFLVPPPHTLNSLIRCISHMEDFSYNFWHQLFTGVASKSPMNKNSVWMLESGGPGSAPEKALVFVKSADLTCWLRVKYPRNRVYPGQLSIKRYDRIRTDGVLRREALSHVNTTARPGFYHSVYRASTDTAHGFVMADDVALI